MKQELVWMQWVRRPELPGGGVFETTDLPQEPTRLWSLTGALDRKSPPKLPIKPVHHENAFLEDRMHDWNWRAGKLRYYTRVMDRSCWVLVEFKDGCSS